MKKTNKRVKYAGGTSVVTYIEDPSEFVAKNDIAFRKAQSQASSDPLIQGMKAVGGFLMNKGFQMLPNQMPDLVEKGTGAVLPG